MKQRIDPLEHANEILTAVKKGVLITAKCGEKVNPMTISWGTLGIQWGKPIFTAFVRGCRYTEPMLEQTGEFTVNIPVGTVDKNILKVCGTQSGKDIDKVATLGLHLEEPAVISAPGIRELPLTLECKVIYTQQQTPECMIDGELLTHYAKDPVTIHDEYHTVYCGEVVAAYIIN